MAVSGKSDAMTRRLLDLSLQYNTAIQNGEAAFAAAILARMIAIAQALVVELQA